MNPAADFPPGGWLELRGRTILHLTGPDRIRYLNGQVSIDIPRLAGDLVRPGCVLNAKGRLVALAWFHREPDALRVDADAGLREALGARLERYIVADDVALVDHSDGLVLFHRPTPPPEPDPLGDLPWVAATRLGRPGLDLCVPVGEADAVRGRLAAAGPELDPDTVEHLRIERGVPRWGAELGPDTLPPEAGLDATAIDYDKGCYLGQEIISRLRSVGHVNRELRHLVAARGTPRLEAGQALLAPDGTPAGGLTSATFSFALDTWLGLGYVKKSFRDPGTPLHALSPQGADRVAVEVRLPPQSSRT